jgi:hypothetical protein
MDLHEGRQPIFTDAMVKRVCRMIGEKVGGKLPWTPAVDKAQPAWVEYAAYSRGVEVRVSAYHRGLHIRIAQRRGLPPKGQPAAEGALEGNLYAAAGLLVGKYEEFDTDTFYGLGSIADAADLLDREKAAAGGRPFPVGALKRAFVW